MQSTRSRTPLASTPLAFAALRHAHCPGPVPAGSPPSCWTRLRRAPTDFLPIPAGPVPMQASTCRPVLQQDRQRRLWHFVMKKEGRRGFLEGWKGRLSSTAVLVLPSFGTVKSVVDKSVEEQAWGIQLRPCSWPPVNVPWGHGLLVEKCCTSQMVTT